MVQKIRIRIYSSAISAKLPAELERVSPLSDQRPMQHTGTKDNEGCFSPVLQHYGPART